MLDLTQSIRSAVSIRSIEVLSVRDHLFLRVRSDDGAEGIVLADLRLPLLLPILKQLVIPYFVGKDARLLAHLVDGVYRHGANYKFAGMPFWDCVGHVELAVWDMLGRIARSPAAGLIAPIVRRQVPIYLSSFGRSTTPEQELAPLIERMEATGARAIKLKVGGRMSGNADGYPGRSEALIAHARKALPPDTAIYVDANGSYDADRAIALGRVLEEHGIGWFEEPCPWEEHEQTKRVADALGLAVAGGEQDSSWPRFRWMIEQRAVDIIQPDMLYNGGLLRAWRVAELAAGRGISICPHSPRVGPGLAPMLQLASIVRNLGPHQEYHAAARLDGIGFVPKMTIEDGCLAIPAGPGLGIEYDPSLWTAAVVI